MAYEPAAVVTVTDAAAGTIIKAANTAHDAVTLINQGANPVWLAFSSVPVADRGDVLPAAVGGLPGKITVRGPAAQSDIRGICAAAATSTVSVQVGDLQTTMPASGAAPPATDMTTVNANTGTTATNTGNTATSTGEMAVILDSGYDPITGSHFVTPISLPADIPIHDVPTALTAPGATPWVATGDATHHTWQVVISAVNDDVVIRAEGTLNGSDAFPLADDVTRTADGGFAIFSIGKLQATRIHFVSESGGTDAVVSIEYRGGRA